MKELRIVLKKARAISWNTIYESKHWTTRKRIATDVHEQVRAALIDVGIHPFTKKFLFTEKVHIFINGYFSHSPTDSDNIAAKLYIDGLKMVVLYDDDMKYVGRVSTESFIDRQNPRVEIIIQTII